MHDDQTDPAGFPGRHLIAGAWVAAGPTFANDPVEGPACRFHDAGPAEVAQAAEAAEKAFAPYSGLSRAARADFLRAIADEVEARGDDLTRVAMRETGLPEARLAGERARTTGQLRLFADHLLDGRYLGRRVDPALPDRKPLPRPDLRMVHLALGPVAVFGASNFPLAFSVAGGDTASALAAGCPVVVKGHPAHPGTSEIVARAILAAQIRCGIPLGAFSLLQSSGRAAGIALVQHPLIQSVGFTGSLAAGRALFDLCAARPVPIPFFGELGSINPVFALPEALRVRGDTIARGWVASVVLGAGQFCTNPGVIVMVGGAGADGFADAAQAAVAQSPAQTMLSGGIAAAYRAGCAGLAGLDGVAVLHPADSTGRTVAPQLARTTAAAFLDQPRLAHEVFGPSGLIVVAESVAQMQSVAKSLDGQLTATIQMSEADTPLAADLLAVLHRKAGRILVNGFPTGVEVAEAMVHGGPYPASTNFGATSVGTLSIRRWLRPVCYQDVPTDLLPAELRAP